MLALVTIFLLTLSGATAAIWLYRTISGWHGFKQTVISPNRTTALMKLKAQQGYISLVPSKRKQVKKVKLRSSKGGIKTPWGW